MNAPKVTKKPQAAGSLRRANQTLYSFKTLPKVAMKRKKNRTLSELGSPLAVKVLPL